MYNHFALFEKFIGVQKLKCFFSNKIKKKPVSTWKYLLFSTLGRETHLHLTVVLSPNYEGSNRMRYFMFWLLCLSSCNGVTQSIRQSGFPRPIRFSYWFLEWIYSCRYIGLTRRRTPVPDPVLLKLINSLGREEKARGLGMIQKALSRLSGRPATPPFVVQFSWQRYQLQSQQLLGQ